MEKKQIKKTNSFFCCSSGSKKRIKQDGSAIVISNTKEEVNQSKNSPLKVSQNSLGIEEDKNNYNQNSKKENSGNTGNTLHTGIVPKVQNKDSFVSNHNDSSRSITPRIIEKVTRPGSEILIKSQNVLEKNNNNSLLKEENRISSNIIPLKQNLSFKFEKIAKEKDSENLNLSNENLTIKKEENLNISNKEILEDLSIPNEESNIGSILEKKLDLSNFNSNHKDKFSIKEGDFTFKKSLADTRSEKPLQLVSFTKEIDISDFQNNREQYKQSVATVFNNKEQMNLKIENFAKNNFSQIIDINNNNSKVIEINVESSNPSFNPTITNPSIQMNNHNMSKSINIPFDNATAIRMTPLNMTDDNILSDDFLMNEQNDLVSDESESHSIISSQVLSHINTPKMITGIKTTTDQSIRFSLNSKSEMSNLITENNILMTDNNVFMPIMPSQADDTEFEIINENSDRFNKFIETPKSYHLFYSNLKNSNIGNNTTQIIHPQLKEINDKLNKKDREAKKLNEKIQKIVSDLHKLEEENRRYERRIEKEEADGEMLKHMLNFLTMNA